ncbi:MAG: hypothetical protein LBT52_01465 [Clostridiales Family XIII bacterium]|jgi:hypothetical protein|nr:hypothetical protein [Clostridiales Family XIII bacterium]
MRLLNGWPFVSKEVRARQEREFDERIFPLGMEAQRDKMKEVLLALIPKSASKIQYILFACLLSKDLYLQNDKTEEGIRLAKARLDKILRNTEEEKLLIMTLAQMDAETDSLETYPTPEQVRKTAGLD